MSESTPAPRHFIQIAVREDLDSGRFEKVVTRFPPEPNGYPHIGHAKAICVSYGIAQEFGGRFNLRFDDTNPVKEEAEFVEAIQEDIRWLGCPWDGEALFTSDYFDTLYDWAVQLIRDGNAFVCEQSAAEIREFRGTLKEPGRESPWRDRPVEESLDQFARMRAGEFPEGSRTLRARIDMASPNMNLRDPVLYRILHAPHHRTGTAWHIYPTYDWAHGQSDSIEGISHSLCSLEFQDHRPLYNWFLEQLGVFLPRQIEFARLNLSHTLMSKRVLRTLVEEGIVDGWDDPRMPTLRGMRRRGYPPEALRAFCDRVGVARDENLVEMAMLEFFVREQLNRQAHRTMAVLRPLKVVIDNYPEDGDDAFEVPVNPEDEAAGKRRVPFSRELWIEQGDFLEEPPPKYFRLAPGREVRLRGGYFIRYASHIKDDEGRVVEVRCTYDPETHSGQAPDGRRPNGTIHWISARHSLPARVRLYETLFSVTDPRQVPDGEDWRVNLNPESREILDGVQVDPGLGALMPGEVVQFERIGYFVADADSAPGAPVFNRTVTLRDTWKNIQKRGG